MQLNCPHCKNPIDVVDASPLDQPLVCPSCGSRWTNWSADTQGETATYASASPGKGKVGRFELLNLLGRGHFGEVWSARDPRLERQVAIKIPRKENLDDSDIERFIREARAAAQLKHPHIVPIHEVGRDKEMIYIVSELIHGANLADRIHAGWKSNFADTSKLCATMAEALHHAHTQGVVHRDFKPGNVLIANDEVPYLTDFGLAKREGAEITMTVEGRIMGTPAYMSPEQARGDGHNADARSDVYSLGVVLYELLTGKRPFTGTSQILVQQILTKDPPLPRSVKKDVPKDLQTICMKCLEKDPAGRYQTAKEVADELRRYLAGEPILARPIPIYTRWARWSQRNKRLATTMGISAALLLMLGTVGYDNYRRYQADLPVYREVTIKTYPEGARVVCVPLHPETGEPMGEKKVMAEGLSPVTVSLTPGDYLVVAEVKGHGFHEVFRHVPAVGKDGRSKTQYDRDRWRQGSWEESKNGSIILPAIVIHALNDIRMGMISCEGGEVPLLSLDSEANAASKDYAELLQKYPPRTTSPLVNVEPFWIDSTETTMAMVRQFWQKACAGPLDIQQALDITCNDAESRPLHIDDARYTDDRQAVVDLTYDKAVYLAETLGKRLCLEEEYLWAATGAGTRKFPWGDEERPSEWRFEEPLPANGDQSLSNPPIFGLWSGVGEWTSSWPNPLPTEPQLPRPRELANLHAISRVVRGIPTGLEIPTTTGVVSGDPRSRLISLTSAESSRIGVRMVISDKPRFLETAPK